MKTKLGVLICLVAATLAHASTLRSSSATEDGQTNNLTALLQQGLLEEQANHNLDAAIADYQSLVTQFGKDRKLAATAIFRLGECYRMQGKTNEAALEYQRILREFPDEKMLATLSRQNLGVGQFPAASPAEVFFYTVQPGDTVSSIIAAYRKGGISVLLNDLLAANPGLDAKKLRTGQRIAIPFDDSIPATSSSLAEAVSLNLWNRVKNLPQDQLEQVLPTLAPDPVLTSLLQQRNEAETKLAASQKLNGPENPDIVSQKAALGAINKQISEKISGIMEALKIRAELNQQPLAPQHIFYVGGEVKMPGRFAFVGETTVTKAIQTAGDFTDFANRTKVKLIRNNGQVIIVNCIKALENPSLDPPVHPGDQIQVPRRIF